jgi:hypothetical protein
LFDHDIWRGMRLWRTGRAVWALQFISTIALSTSGMIMDDMAKRETKVVEINILLDFVNFLLKRTCNCVSLAFIAVSSKLDRIK